MGDLTWRDWQDNLLLREMTRVIDQPRETSCMGAPTFEPTEEFCKDEDLVAEAQQERDQAQAAGYYWHRAYELATRRIGEIVGERDATRKSEREAVKSCTFWLNEGQQQRKRAEAAESDLKSAESKLTRFVWATFLLGAYVVIDVVRRAF